jgi:hypothetical protein
MERSYVFPSNFAPRHFGSKKAKKNGKIGGSNIFIELEALAVVVNSCVEFEFPTIALEECSIMRYITR